MNHSYTDWPLYPEAYQLESQIGYGTFGSVSPN